MDYSSPDSFRMPLPACYDKAGVQGNCKPGMKVKRWTYVDGICQEFYYNGCDGTRNNFESYKECINVCTKGWVQ